MNKPATKFLVNIRPWLVVFSASSFFFLINSSTNLNGIAPYLKTQLHFSAIEISFLFACYYYTNIVFVFWAGVILDKVSAKKILITVFIVANCSILVFAITKSLLLMALARLILGIVGSFSLLICFQLIKRWFPFEKIALVNGFVITYATLGTLFSQTPLILAIEKFGWSTGLLLNFWLGIFFCIFALIFAQDFPATVQVNNIQQHTSGNKTTTWCAIKGAITNYSNWLIGLCAALFSIPGLFFSASWGILYLQQAGNLTELESSYVINANIIGTLAGSSLVGWLSDRFRTRKIPLISSVFFVIIILLIIAYVTKLSLLTYAVLFFLLGLILSSQVVIFPMTAENNPSYLVGTATGLVAALTALGGICMPFFGWLMDYCAVGDGVADSYLPIMWALISTIVVGLFLILFVKER